METEVKETQALLDTLRDRLLRMYPEQIRACLAELTDEQIWWRPNEGANSVGHLVLHLCGNLRHYLGRGVAGDDYRRDRPAEFAAAGPLPREELLRRLDEALDAARRAFDAAGRERLLEEAELGPESQPIGGLLVHCTTHFAGHAGQIVYVTKALQEGVFRDELWKRLKER